VKNLQHRHELQDFRFVAVDALELDAVQKRKVSLKQRMC